jgi:hydrogenase-4 transcriptional activator
LTALSETGIFHGNLRTDEGMLLLKVWREAGSHASFEEVLGRIGALVREELPIRDLLIRRFEPERNRISGPISAFGDQGSWGLVRTELSSRQVEALVAWSRLDGVAVGVDGEISRWIVPAGEFGDAITGALLDDDRVIGFAVATGVRGRLTEPHARIWNDLREPLSAALRSEIQRQELVRHQEALEADKQALLSRLGRQEITDAIVGVEAGLRGVMGRVSQVAGADVPVLLLGETGTGKEVIAREIHRGSPRADGPIVRVNCGAIPSGLIDSELFGHERGSFTGAVADRAGWFERADGGTLFLDEIGELSLDAQVRLLRVLQDGTFERVGGKRTHTVDVRIVAATHRDLHAMVKNGGFREDLWYRISVFPIPLPPLRDRIEDIPALVEHFAWRAGKRLVGVPLTPTPHDIDLLIGYSWPGNVRELAAVIERAALLGGGHRLEIPGALGLSSTPSSPVAEFPLASEPERISTLDEAIRRHIEVALRRTDGRIEGPSGTAALLGVNPHTLRARMRKLRIDWAGFRRRGA